MAGVQVCYFLLLTAVIVNEVASMGYKTKVMMMETSSPNGNFKLVVPGPAQRCYSFSCFQNRTSYMTWKGTQSNAYVAFYTQHGCKGDSVKIFGSSGTISASSYDMDKKIASFMILESGRYATRGSIDACPTI